MFFIILLTFSQSVIYLSKIFSSFIIKYIRIRLVLSEYLSYILIWKEYPYGSNFFIIFVTNEIFEILFTKGKLTRYYYFINLYIVFRNRAFVLMISIFFNFSAIQFYNLFIHFCI